MNRTPLLLNSVGIFLLVLCVAAACDQWHTAPSGNGAGGGFATGGTNTAGTGAAASGGAAAGGGNSTAGGASSGPGNTMDGAAASVDASTDAAISADGGIPGIPAVTNALPVELGVAGTFAILAKTGIATVPTSIITGNIGVSPVAATYITGFDLTADSSNVFSSSAQITGKAYAANYATPTPSNMTTAIGDMERAFTDAASRAPDVSELGAGNIGGMTLVPGVYKWSTGLLIPADVTLSGSATGVWIFQIAQDLTMNSATRVVLAGGAQSKNIFWQVSGLVDLDTTAHCEGVVLTQTAITLRTGASINGRLLAQTAVNVDSSTVIEPAP